MTKKNLDSSVFSLDDVEILEREAGYRGFFQLDILTLRHKLFEGGWGKPITRELFLRGSAVLVLLYDPKADRVALTDQFRVGAIDEEHGPWVREVVAGMVEEGESLEDVARRELEEEAGVTDVELEFICHYLPSPGGTDEKVYLYCGIADLSEVEGVYGLPEEGEDIRVITLSAEEAFNQVATGFNNAGTIVAVQWLQLNRERLRAAANG